MLIGHLPVLEQKYVVGELDFEQHRFGVMYGRVDEGGHVFCDAIYEPPQEGNDVHTHRASPHLSTFLSHPFLVFRSLCFFVCVCSFSLSALSNV